MWIGGVLPLLFPEVHDYLLIQDTLIWVADVENVEYSKLVTCGLKSVGISLQFLRWSVWN